MTVLWHGGEPIGICVFTAPALALRGRQAAFGWSGRWTRYHLQALNRQLVTLSRVVLHPTYRGAGLASRFVRRSCQQAPWPWIECLAELGHLHPFLERAGFRRVRLPAAPRRQRSHAAHSALYGGRYGRLLTIETHDQSRFAQPAYFLFDNRSANSLPMAGSQLDAQTHHPAS
ncbi:MAG: hypothetical protein KatS3mg114_1399 [Planctomycetaceae bacterium]|nr:MAG: hypothetical protein KatS3mg114_1399 [Planctomycetaceae bacterium]